MSLLFHFLSFCLLRVFVNPKHVLSVVLYLPEIIASSLVRLIVHSVLLLFWQVLVHQIQSYQNHVRLPVYLQVFNTHKVSYWLFFLLFCLCPRQMLLSLRFLVLQCEVFHHQKSLESRIFVCEDLINDLDLWKAECQWSQKFLLNPW